MRLFFVQTEDGIRDYDVTGVQTCALPISRVIRQVGKFKLGQDETPETFEKIVQHLSPSPLAELMRRTREGADT